MNSHKKLLDYFCRNRITDIAYKLHPKQYSHGKSLEGIENLLNSYKGELNFVQIEKEKSLEVISTQGGMNFYISFSSVAIYAKLFGNSVYSIYPWIIQSDKEANKILKRMPRVFTNSIKTLNN